MRTYFVRFILFFGLFAATSVGAREQFESNLSVRALGMGNAYVSAVKDAYALFYNPARLAAVEGFNCRLMDPYLLVSEPTKIQTVSDAGSSGDSVSDLLDPFFDTNANVGLGMRAAFTMPRFGVSLYGDAQIGVNLNNPVLPDLALRAVTDYGVVAGIALPLIPMLDIGLSIRRVIRQGGDIPITATTIAELDVDQIMGEIERRGSAFGLDMGVTLTPPGPLDLAASFVWKNVGGLSFKKTGGPSKPPSEDDEMIIGVAGGLDLPLFGVTAALDIQNLSDSDVQMGQKIHLGVEVNLVNIDVRAGLYQGYYTLGVGISLGLIELDVASYGVELGEFPGQREDRRYALQLTIELGVDPFFGLGGGTDGKGGGSDKRVRRQRGVKQRR